MLCVKVMLLHQHIQQVIKELVETLLHAGCIQASHVVHIVVGSWRSPGALDTAGVSIMSEHDSALILH